MEKTFAEFFAGIGLVRLGLEAAGWKALFANDIDPKKFEIYRDNFSDAEQTFRVCDVHDLNHGQIPLVTLATASFPCTDLSLAGYRRGLAGEQSGAFWGFGRILEEMDGQRPPLVMIENVTGFLTSHGGRDFYEAMRFLNRLGYTCDAFVLDAIHFVPQSRPRLFVIGVRDMPRTPMLDEALTRRSPALTSPQLSKFILGHRDLSWAILDLPPPPKNRTPLAALIERLPSNEPRWWSRDRVEYLLSQMSRRHAMAADTLRASPTIRYATVYRRIRHGKSMAELRADDVAGCLRTPRGGSSRQILLALGRGEVRARFMTPREYARLQGVPDSYAIRVADNQALFGFGDAVCVPAIAWVAELALNPVVSEERVSQFAQA